MKSRVVLVTALRSSLGLSGSHDGLAVADLRHPDAVETMLATYTHDGNLIVTCADDDAEEVRRLLTFTAVRSPGFRAALEPLPGSPLAVGVVSSLIDDLQDESGNTFAWQLSAIDHLRSRLWSAVWLPSVAGLTKPAPSLLQHVGSWMPGSGYLAIYSDGGRVLRAAKAPIKGIAPRPETALLHSSLAQSTWVVDAVASGLASQSVSHVATVREQVDSFGTAQAIEFVGIPMLFHTESTPAPEAVVTCRACGARHARLTCPLCRMAAPAASVVLVGGHS